MERPEDPSEHFDKNYQKNSWIFCQNNQYDYYTIDPKDLRKHLLEQFSNDTVEVLITKMDLTLDDQIQDCCLILTGYLDWIEEQLKLINI